MSTDITLYEEDMVKVTPNIFWLDLDNMYRLSNPGSGSCLFYSVIQGIYAPLTQGYDDSLTSVVDQQKFIMNLRRKMARELENRVDLMVEESETWYDHLSGGTLEEQSRTVKEYSIENLKQLLVSGRTPDLESEILIEFMSKLFEVDIYILEEDSGDIVYLDDSYYEGRTSVILYHTTNHYELLVRKESDGSYVMNFKSGDNLIEDLKTRLRERK